MKKLLATIGATLGLAALVVITSPAGQGIVAGLSFNGLD
jgi:hypothetical protein